jgi:hypothetical protein
VQQLKKAQIIKMSLLFKKSEKELLSIRNSIFKEVGIPALEKKGFIKSPFSTSWFGRNNLGDYTYEFCRLSKDSILEIITIHISKGDKSIKIFLNIFKLLPEIKSIENLNNYDGLHYDLPPNSLSEMRLRDDDYKGPPLFYMLFCPEHKIGKYYTQNGFDRKVKKLSELIKKDMTNIDAFVKKWHELHQINQTDWEGNKLD